jgi:hypothetical protein
MIFVQHTDEQRPRGGSHQPLFSLASTRQAHSPGGQGKKHAVTQLAHGAGFSLTAKDWLPKQEQTTYDPKCQQNSCNVPRAN